MSSMKLCKSNPGYGANQTKLSQYHHQEYNMSQSTQSHPSHLGSSMHAYDQFDRATANNSTRYHAQANSVLPSPSVQVQQTNHVTETLKMQESHTDQQWSLKNDTSPNSARSSYSTGTAIYGDDGANKLTQCSSPVQANQNGMSMFRSKDDKSYENNSNSFDVECLSPMKANNHEQTIHGGIDKTNKFYSSAEMGHSDHAMQEGLMIGSKGQSWVSSPTQPIKSSLAISKSHYMSESVDHALVNSPTRANSSTFNMGREDHMLGEIDGGLGMKSSNGSNVIKANQYGQSMYKRQGDIGYTTTDHGIHNSQYQNSARPYQHGSRHTIDSGRIEYGQSTYKGSEYDVFNFNDGDIKSDCINKHGLKQHYYSSNNNHNGQEQYGSMVSQLGHLVGPNQYGSSHMYNGQDQYGQSIYEGKGKVFNFHDRDIEGDCISNLAHKQYNYSSNNMHKGPDQYGSMMSHSGHSAYNKHHEYNNDNVNDIMDEILSKYPAHNVSAGYGACASQPKQFSYASSTSSSSAKMFGMSGMMNNGGFYNT